MSDWKKRFQKPSSRTLIYSKKLDKWLNETDENIALMEMAHDKRAAVMKKLIETDSTLTPEEAQKLAEEMLSKPNESIKLLQDDSDEPSKEEESSSEGS